jgi:hydroxyethylthiazole kinase-like uncharacterized protein yjeF
MQVSSVAQMRALDRVHIEQDGIPEALLMENAGLAAVQVLAQHYQVNGRRWVILCGVGNNGGDALVVARQLASRGAVVDVCIVGDPARYGDAAALNYRMAQAVGVPVCVVDTVAPVMDALAACDGVVDGLLGTGITRPVAGLLAAVIQAVNGCGKPVVSLDIASGVNGDTGQVMGCAVQADHTITFGLPKVGNLLYPGFAQGGRLWVSHIGFTRGRISDPGMGAATNDPVTLPPRDATGHKGSFGDTLVVAGAGSYYGAPYLAALACLRGGGGYVRLAAPASVVPVVASRAGEVVYVPLAETAARAPARENRARLLALAEQVDFVILGPGTSLEPETQELLREMIASVDRPLLVDGDGLTALVGGSPLGADLVRGRHGPTVLTPHVGEFARLTGMRRAAIEADRVAALRQACAAWGAVIVLKGAHSLIGYPDGRVVINLSGNSGMATAGSGDVLTGAIAAMHGLGLDFATAVRMGVFVHGVAGDLAAAARGEDGMTAQDVLDALPEAVRQCRRREAGWLRRYTLPTTDEAALR